MPDPHQAPHVLLLLTSRTYRAEAFIQAASQLGVDLTIGVEAGSVASVSPGQVELEFTDLDQGVTAIRSLSQSRAFNAILAAEDEGALLAANAAASLGLTHSSLDAVLSARDKLRMRQRLAGGDDPTLPRPLSRRQWSDGDGQGPF